MSVDDIWVTSGKFKGAMIALIERIAEVYTAGSDLLQYHDAVQGNKKNLERRAPAHLTINVALTMHNFRHVRHILQHTGKELRFATCG